jgi:hypothetical protein
MGASDVITVILNSITTFLSGIGSAIVDFFEVLVWDSSASSLTTMGLWLLVFLGLALAIGIARLVFAIFRTRR